MAELKSSLAKLTFIKPYPVEHAPTTLDWFESRDGPETLRLMGNPESEIGVPSLETEIQILEEFVSLETEGKQITWMINFEDTVIGVAWIELVENHTVKSPSVHLMIGDKKYRGKGIGTATMQALITCIKDTATTKYVYSRHLKSNHVVAKMNAGLGFEDDGAPYVDNDGLEWQNIVLAVAAPKS